MLSQGVKSADVLLSAWEKTLARKASAPAVFDSRGCVVRTFGDLETRAREIQTELADRPPGEVYPIDLGNHPDWPATLLACLQHGLVALPLDESITPEQRTAARRICAQGDWAEHRPVLLKLTSGTTAAPRAIRFRSEQLLADCDQICATMGISETDINFGVIPVSHSYGLSNLITPLLARGVPMALSRDRLPRAVLNDLARTGATVFPGMPVFYQAFCAMEKVPPLPKLRLCISAGAPLPLAVAQKFRERFGPAVHSFYGSSECGGICYDREAALREEGFVGVSMEGVTVNLLTAGADPSQAEVLTAAAGDGYLPLPDDEKLCPGRFVPDDLLVKSAGGYRIVGRVSDVINVAGKKVAPAEVEAVLLRYAGVREALVFGRASRQRNEEVVACVVAEAAVLENELIEFCRGHLNGWQVPRRIFFLDAMPVNERGKVNRRELTVRFATP